MSRSIFGTFDGTPVLETRIAGGALRASVIDYGAVLRDLELQLPDGRWQRLILGFDRLEDYRQHSPHAGAIAGRFANRIANGRFVLDGVEYALPRNLLDLHSIHGGGAGFGKRPWTTLASDADSVTLGIVSPDGEVGYPGAVIATCRYRLEASTLRIELTAVTDKPTVINLTNHAYFNLDGSPDILDHTLSIRANVRSPTDANGIPDGSLAPVSGTPYDFRVPRPVRQKKAGGGHFGYDSNYLLRRDKREADRSGLELALAATVSSNRSGVTMEAWTTEPCVQFYDAHKLHIPVAGLGGATYGPCAGLCLETQHAPDSPNLPHLPSTELRPGAVYRHITEYRFSVG